MWFNIPTWIKSWRPINGLVRMRWLVERGGARSSENSTDGTMLTALAQPGRICDLRFAIHARRKTERVNRKSKIVNGPLHPAFDRILIAALLLTFALTSLVMPSSAQPKANYDETKIPPYTLPDP